MTDYAQTIEAWKVRRLAALKAPDGWLNIIGRYWLSPGTANVGSAPHNDIVLPAGPAHVGTLTQDADGGVTYAPADGGAPQVLKLDKKSPPRFSAGNLLLEVTTLNGENALRVRDTASAEPRRLTHIDYFRSIPPGGSLPTGYR